MADQALSIENFYGHKIKEIWPKYSTIVPKELMLDGIHVRVPSLVSSHWGPQLQGCQNPCRQVLRTDREGMIDDVITHGT